MKKIAFTLPLVLALAACGTNQEQRASTGALAGGLIGGLAGGPLGFGIGLGVGAAAGAVTPMGVDEAAMMGKEKVDAMVK